MAARGERRIVGVSGILHGLFGQPPGDRRWRAAFIAGLIIAVAVTAVAFRPLLRRKPIDFKSSVDAPLLISAAIFGIGWGIGGYCPGPALTALSNLSAVFVAAMIAAGVFARIASPAGPGA